MIVKSDFRQVAQGNVDLLNEMLTELVPDQVPFIIIARVISVILILICSRQEHPEDRKLLEELGSSCKEIQVTIIFCQLANIFVKADSPVYIISDKQEVPKSDIPFRYIYEPKYKIRTV